MKSMIKITGLSLILLFNNVALAAQQNVVLVTLDGVRWQEVFNGADKNLLNNKEFVKQPAQLSNEFWDERVQQRQQLLMPFLTQTIATQGVIMGDRANGSAMSVSNPWYFSYPGYNEILTGEVDENIKSNDKVFNPNKTIFLLLVLKNNYASY